MSGRWGRRWRNKGLLCVSVSGCAHNTWWWWWWWWWWYYGIKRYKQVERS